MPQPCTGPQGPTLNQPKLKMDLSEIVACSNWSEVVARLESKLRDTLEKNATTLIGIRQAATMGNRIIKPGSSFDIEIKECEKIHESLVKILEGK